MLQSNQIYLGDCLEKIQQIDDKSVDCVVCDLPFGVTACEWDKVIDIKKLFIEYRRITKVGGNLFVRNRTIFNATKI